MSAGADVVTVYVSLISPARTVYPSLVSEKKFSVGSTGFPAPSRPVQEPCRPMVLNYGEEECLPVIVRGAK